MSPRHKKIKKKNVGIKYNLTLELIEYQLEEWTRTSTLQDACWAAQTELHTWAWEHVSSFSQGGRKQKEMRPLQSQVREHCHLKIQIWPVKPTQSHRTPNAKCKEQLKRTQNLLPVPGSSSPKYCFIKSRTCVLLRSYSLASCTSKFRRFS